MILDDAAMKEIPLICQKIVDLATKKGKLDTDELDRRLGQLVCDRLLDDIQPVNEPPKPESLREYEMFSVDQKFRFDKENPEWRRMPQIIDYLDAKSAYTNKNNAHIDHLEMWRGVVDDHRAEKFRQKIMEFKQKMRSHSGFKPNVVKTTDPVGNALGMFGGRMSRGGRKEDEIQNRG